MPQFASPREARLAIRRGEHTGTTAGLCPGYVQANLVILPAEAAEEFAEFCRLNPAPCPVIARTAPGDPEPRDVAPGADLRTDVPRYRVFRHGQPQRGEPSDITALWRDDFIAFLLGCSFTFDAALSRAGLPVRHVQRGCNVPMYRTQVPCQPAGRFAGNLVVSMRPMPAEMVARAAEVTSRYPQMHGAPVHAGDPAVLGIADLARPDFGDAVPLEPGEVPVFWACGVTPQVALEQAACSLAITHSPGCMFLTDVREEDFLPPATGV